jgi:hypothetical protein
MEKSLGRLGCGAAGASDVSGERPRILLAIFLALIAIYVVSPVRTPYDSRWSIYEAMSFLHGHDGNLAEYQGMLEQQKFYAIEYHHGKPYTLFPSGVSFLAVPFVALASIIDPSFSDRIKTKLPDRFEAFVASFYGALAGTIFYCLLLYRFGSRAIALVASFVFCFETAMWSTATRALWQQGPLILMFVVATMLLLRARERAALSQYVGLPLAMAFVIRPTAAIPIFVLTSYVLVFHRAWFLRYLLWSLVVALPWLAYNLFVYDNILSPYYMPGRVAGTTVDKALLGNLISPSRGLFVYSPILILGFSGFALALKQAGDRWLSIAFMTIVVLHWLIVSRFPMWWGGDGYGPRLMIDILPFLAYFIGFNLPWIAASRGWARGAWIAGMALLGLPSLLLNANGAIHRKVYDWNNTPVNLELAPARLWDWRDPQFLRDLGLRLGPTLSAQ